MKKPDQAKLLEHGVLSEQDALVYIAKELSKFFEDEPYKANMWLFTPNLNFGGMAPAKLILVGRAWKLAQIIKDMREQNTP